MILTVHVMQMIHCLINILGTYLHMRHTMVSGWTATAAMWFLIITLIEVQALTLNHFYRQVYRQHITITL